MDPLDAFYQRRPELKGYRDTELRENRELTRKLIDRQNTLIQLMNRVAGQYIKWSLAKDRFISEIINYSSAIDSRIFTSQLSLQDAIYSLEREIEALKRQQAAMMAKQVRQVVAVKPVVKETASRTGEPGIIHVGLTIAGIGFIGGGLQVAAGVGMMGSGIAMAPGALLTAHGINNMIENGHYLLYRESYTGPLRFIYKGAGDLFGVSARHADVIYAFVDLGLSVNSMLGYRLADDAQRLYRYINADLLWGLKRMGIRFMSKNDLVIEFIGSANTVVGQYDQY